MFELDSIRDLWTNTTTYFWREQSSGKVTSPYFDTEDLAQEWQRQNLVDGGALVSTGVDSRDGNTGKQNP